MRAFQPSSCTWPPNPTRTRVVCQRACNVLAMTPMPKQTPTEIKTVAFGKRLPVEDTDYFSELDDVSSPLS